MHSVQALHASMDLEHWVLKYVEKISTFQNQEGYWSSYFLSKCLTALFSGACVKLCLFTHMDIEDVSQYALHFL